MQTRVDGRIYKKLDGTKFEPPTGRYPMMVPSLGLTYNCVQVRVDGKYYVIFTDTQEVED